MTRKTYDDGHEKCFGGGCKYFKPPEGDAPGAAPREPRAPRVTGLLRPDWSTMPTGGLLKRRLKLDTLRKFGVFEAGYKGSNVLVHPYHNRAGEVVNQKLRFPDKQFLVLAAEDAIPMAQCQLFGQHVWGDRFDRQLIVTEGEFDAMSVAQAQDFRTAVVSINTGASSAAATLKANYLWVDRFAEIVLWFDDDAAGQAALAECAGLFEVGKVRIAKANGFKDASDCLQADKPGDITSAIYAAVAWRPAGIVNAKGRGFEVLAPKERVLSWEYPPSMRRLQEMSGGMRGGDAIYQVAGTGVGKSTQLREIIHHAMVQGAKVGLLSFEDTTRDAMIGIMSIAADQKLGLIPIPDPEDTDGCAVYDRIMTTYHEKVFGSGQLELFDAENAEWSTEAILKYIRYMAKGLDCDIVVVDPLSFVASGISLKDDERRVLDYVAGAFARTVKELGIHMQIAHHLKRTQGVPHEEGAPTSINELRSSGALGMFSMGVVGWERNQQAEGDSKRVVQSRIIKPMRHTGQSGLADVLYYNDNGRLVPSHLPFPPIGKPENEGEEGTTRNSRFGAASESGDY